MKIEFTPDEVKEIILAHAIAITHANFNTVEMGYSSIREVTVSYKEPEDEAQQ